MPQVSQEIFAVPSQPTRGKGTLFLGAYTSGTFQAGTKPRLSAVPGVAHYYLVSSQKI